MLDALVHRLTHVGHRRSPSASSGRGRTAPAVLAGLRAVLLGSLLVTLAVAIGLTVLYASAVVDGLVGDLVLWFVGVTAVGALPSLVVSIGRRLYP